jgi:hypothetical protein
MSRVKDDNLPQHDVDRFHYGEMSLDLMPSGSQVAVYGFSADGGASVLTTGVKVELPVFFNSTIVGVEMLADVSGSCVVDIQKGTYGGFPTTATIVDGSAPTLSSAIRYLDQTLSGWTTGLSDGDVLRFKIDSISSIKRLSVALKVQRT